ncbi:MAG: efflux RND transporter permease subunit, partial [Armatimonadetes bacterium]|nr:efflux RND transporter permease subunit [Armatimonadota bacterium]
VWYRRRRIEPERQGTWFTRLAAWYQRVLRTALYHPWRTLACGWGSLALSVGILVDDSIVCLEAITHRLRLGEPAADAAFNGRNDIALADTSTTLVDLAVFVPVALMPGVVGQFFRDFGFVVSVAVALSLVTAYTIVPMMAALWYCRRPIEPERQGTWFSRLAGWYQRVLRDALDHPWRTLACGWGSLALAGLLAWRVLGVDFVPAADLSTVLVNLELPAGASSPATERVTAQAEAIVSRSPEVDTLFTTLGRIETGFGIVARQGPQYAQVNVSLRDRRGMLDRLLFRGQGLRRRSDDAVAEEMRTRLHGLPGVQQLQVIAVKGWGGAGAPVDFSLYGQDLDEMAAVGQAVLRRLGQTEGLINPDISWRLGQPEVQVRFDRERARELHVFPGAVARELRACLAGDEGVSLRVADQHVPVRLRLRDLDRRSAADVARIPVGRTATRVVLVSDVAAVTQGAGPTRIDRRQGRRDLNFKAYLAPGVSLGDVRGRIERELDALGIPCEKGVRQPAVVRYPALTWGWRGDAETLTASAGYMRGTAILGALLVYGIMAALFNSALQPLTIMLSVPMAGAGALLMLVLTGSSLSIVSGIGMILLISIVVRNAILLIDYTLQLRALGVGRREAVEQAGARRLRPILMTTLCTILGMLPVALRIGKGAEIRAPMAIAVIGGLALSTLLTLVIIPVTYEMADRWMERWRGAAPAAPALPAPPREAG